MIFGCVAKTGNALVEVEIQSINLSNDLSNVECHLPNSTLRVVKQAMFFFELPLANLSH